MVTGDELQRCKGEPEMMSNIPIARIIRRDKNKFVFFLDAIWAQGGGRTAENKEKNDKFTYFSNLCEVNITCD